MAEQQQDVDALKRRGRRRLVGAVALVLLAVIILPMVFDPEPRKSAPPVTVRIPGEDDNAFTPKVTPKPAAPKSVDKPAAEKSPPGKKAEEKKVEEKKAAQGTAPEPKAAEAERARAEAALANAQFVVPVGAFANPEPVVAKLAGAKLRYYTEKLATSKGTVTRVRVGPFATKDEAERALEIVKGLGLKPGNVTAKS
jgi:DedD protein